jgi:pimeloyl-ACP methyl ester carboxylesterase
VELYREVKGSGEAILLIHGNGANTRIWGRSAGDLAETHRVIAYDRRGFGRSPGHLAKRMRDHELVSALILEEPGIHLPLNNTVNLFRFGLRAEYARRVRRDQRRAAMEVFEFALAYRDGGSQFDRFSEEWRESMLDSAEATVAETDHMRHPYPTRRGLSGVSCPVTILQGGLSEPTFAKVNRYLLRRMPAAKLVVIEGTAHAVHFDRPEEFRQAVLEAAVNGCSGPDSDPAGFRR